MKGIGIFRKEITRLLRKPSVIVILVLAPFLIAGMGVLMYSNYGISGMKLGFVNLNKDPIGGFTVRLILSFFHGSSVIELKEKNYKTALENGEVNAVIIIPEDFTKLLYAKKKSYLYFIPSPYDLQIAAGIYVVISSLFNDLEGSMFFDPKVLRYLFVGKGYPAPEVIPKSKEKALDFDSVMAPAIIFLSGVLVVITLSSLAIIEEKEKGIVNYYKIADLNPLSFTLNHVLSYSILGILESFVAYGVFSTLTGSFIDIKFLLSLIVITNIFYSIIGFIISSFSPNKGVNVLLMTVCLGFVFFASGSIVPLNSVPKWLSDFIRKTVIFNATIATRKLQIFGEVSLNSEYTTMLISLVLFFLISVLSAKWALRRE